MFRTSNKQKWFSLVIPFTILLLLVLAPTALAEEEDWQAKYEEICSAEPILYDAPGGELTIFPYALITPQNANRPDEDSIVITLMGDGFTEADQMKFNYYAQYFAETIIHYEPFREFKDKIKIYRVNVVSEDSGIRRDHSVNGRDIPGMDPRNNYFGGLCWSGNAQRGMSVSNRDLAINTATAYTNENCWKLLLMNSTLYGGVSSGQLSFSSLNWAFVDLCIHESGHTNGLLPDEYHAGDQYFRNALENPLSYPNLVNAAWIDDPTWQEWNPWHRFLGKDGITFDPFVEVVSSTYDYAGTHYRPSEACKMRFLGYTDNYEKYGVEEFPFCLVCQEKWRDRLAVGSKTPVLHFQPYNDQFYDNVPVTLNNKHLILRTAEVDLSLGTEGGFGGGYSQKIYGEDMAPGELKITVRDAEGKALYQNISATTPMNLEAGTYTVSASYDGEYGRMELSSIENSFVVKHASPIVSVGNYASPWKSEDKMDTLSRPWQKDTPVTLPEVVVDASRVHEDAKKADFEISYTWHLDDGEGQPGEQLGEKGIIGGKAADGPSSVGKFVLCITSEGKSGTPVAGHKVTDLFPFEVESSYYSVTRFEPNSTTYPNENEQNMWRPITIVGEGFTEEEYDEFVALAEDFITKFLDTTPVNHVFERFYFWIQSTLSQDSGISKPGEQKDTYYGFALDENNEFTTYRTDREFNDILRQEVWRRDTNQKTAAQWGATVVFVNDDSVQANANWRHDPELNRSVHLATIKDKSYSKLIEELVNQFAFCLSSRDPELLDRKWMGDPAKTQETLDALIASCYCQHMPVVASDASVRNYVLQNGTVYDLTDGKKAFDVASTFKAYAFGEEIITNTDETNTFTYTYYADDNYSVGELLDGVPSEPGVYWAQAHLPGGNKYFKYDHYIYGKDFDDQIFYGTDAQGNYIYDKDDVPEEYIVRAGSDIMLNSSSTGRWYAPSNARGIVRFVISAADKSALKAQLEALSALKEADYTEKSWAVLAAAVEKAEGIVDDIYADAAAVEAMQKELKQAEDYLFCRSDVANKTAIESLLAYVAMLEKADYTGESWAALQAECSAALAVAENERASKEEVAAAAASLEASIDALKNASYTLRITAEKGGRAYIQGDDEEALIERGSQLILRAASKKGYEFLGWIYADSGESLGFSALQTFTMPSRDVELIALFDKEDKSDKDDEDEETESYTIKATVGAGGSINRDKRETVEEGDDLSYSITPADGYVIKDVLVDGKSVGAVERYTFKDVDEDHEIEILFEAKAAEPTRFNPFIDVKEADWFYSDVLDSYELGLINGRTANTYVPGGNITIAEAIKLAASMHQKYTTGAVTLSNGSDAWYSTYVDYAVANGIIKAGEYTDMNAIATRAQFASIFAAALPEAALPAINAVADGKIPDVKPADPYGAAVYKLYRAGILNGNDAAGSFAPMSNIKRSEVAAIVNRMMNAEKRVSVAL